MTHCLQIERKGRAAFLTLNRPESRNAFDEALMEAVTGFFKSAAKDKSLRAVVLKGAGRHFCAGADIQWLRRAATYSKANNLRDAERRIGMWRAVDDCPVPVIVRIHGSCYAGALGLIAAADIVVAAQDAQMAFSECRIGIIPAMVSPFVIPKIGLTNARRYFLTAETFGAEAALRMGLVHEICPESELDARIDRFLQLILKTGPLAVREAKALIRRVAALDPERRFKHTVAAFARIRATPEAKEGFSAFLEKRPANWIEP